MVNSMEPAQLASIALAAAGISFVSYRIGAARERKKILKQSLCPFSASQGDVVSVEGESEDSTQHARFVYQRLPMEEIKERARAFCGFMNMRRSLRFFSRDTVPLSVIEDCVMAAGTSPSGAHLQPWTFCVVKSADVKEQIREAVEAEEKVNYERRMNAKWVKDVIPVVDHLPKPYIKPYLSEAPYVLVMMKHAYQETEAGERREVYYPEQSCGIAAGLLITALHNANLVTLTSTPMGAESKIRDILQRPNNEKVFLLLPVGLLPCQRSVPLIRPLADALRLQSRRNVPKLSSLATSICFPAADATVPLRGVSELRKTKSSILQVY